MRQALLNFDRRIIYALVALAIAAPLVFPLGLPLDTGRDAETIYKLIESLKPGDKVLFPVDFVSSSIPELVPEGEALMRHLMRRPGVKIVAVSFNDQGHIFADRILTVAKADGKQYGVDYINLGFVAGGEGALAGFLKNVRSVVKVDYTGKAVDDFAIMKDISSVNDFQLVVGPIASAGLGETSWVRQMGVLQVPFAFGTSTAAYSSWVPFVQSGQVKAILSGLRGAAEYEKLIGVTGRATTAMDAQSTAHLVIIALILLGNVAYFINRPSPKRG